MARPMKPLVRGGGYYPSNGWTPLVYPGGYTTANGGGQPEPEAVLKTVTGSLIHITDALALPAEALTVNVEPIQAGSGDPSPDNVRPISGWTGCNVTRTGKNLFNKNASDLQVGYAIDPNTFIVYQTGSGNYNLSGYVPIKGGQTYILSGSSKNCDIVFYDSNKTAISGRSTSGQVTAPDNAVYCRFDYWKADHDSIQLELGSTATAYEPYAGNTYSITFPSEAGTVYGGSLDVTTGKLRSEWLMCDGGDLDWVKVSNSNFRNFYAQGPDVLFYASDVSSILSSAYKSTNNNASSASDDLYVWATALRPNNVISVKDTAKGSMTAEEFKAAMAGVQFLCKRSTPVEFELTPTVVRTLLGANNIWADTGDSTLTYYAEGEASTSEALGILLGGTYNNPGGADDVSDDEALGILLGGS